MDRLTMLKKLEEFKRLSGHGSNIEEMTNEQLEKYLKIEEKAFEDYFQD